MLTLARGLAELRPYAAVGEGTDLVRVVLNAAADLEARIALGMLKLYVPDRQLVTAVNLREVLRELPRTPTPMAIDFAGLAKVGGFTRVKNVYGRHYTDPLGDFEIVVLGEGNMCYDIVLCTAERRVYWSPDPSDDDAISAGALELVLSRETLLDRMIELATSMGLVFNPMLYHSLKEWMLEHPGE